MAPPRHLLLLSRAVQCLRGAAGRPVKKMVAQRHDWRTTSGFMRHTVPGSLAADVATGLESHQVERGGNTQEVSGGDTRWQHHITAT